eukprot:gene23373-biopygen19331
MRGKQDVRIHAFTALGKVVAALMREYVIAWQARNFLLYTFTHSRRCKRIHVFTHPRSHDFSQRCECVNAYILLAAH